MCPNWIFACEFYSVHPLWKTCCGSDPCEHTLRLFSIISRSDAFPQYYRDKDFIFILPERGQNLVKCLLLWEEPTLRGANSIQHLNGKWRSALRSEKMMEEVAGVMKGDEAANNKREQSV